jgi:integrase/recombinase XerD
MQKQTGRERESHARDHWLSTPRYLDGPRIAEAGTNSMGQFFRCGNENGAD